MWFAAIRLDSSGVAGEPGGRRRACSGLGPGKFPTEDRRRGKTDSVIDRLSQTDNRS